jgi:putative addiction module component (TIGR02574 family)
MNIETITEQVLKLAPAARAYIAEILLENLDYEEDFLVSEAWRQEIHKRCQEIDSDPSLLVDGEQFIADLKQRYL